MAQLLDPLSHRLGRELAEHQGEGLLSLKALLCLYGKDEAEISQLTRCRWPDSVQVEGPGLPGLALRDQRPMTNKGVETALRGTAKAWKWYDLINSMVFFWPTKKMLKTISLTLRRLDPVVPRDQFRVPLVRLARHEAVEAVEAPLQGPVVVGTRGACLVDGTQVRLACREGLVSVRTQHLGQVGRLAGGETPGVGEAVDHFRHPSHADAVMVAAGEQAGPGRRAERGDAKVRIAQPVGRKPGARTAGQGVVDSFDEVDGRIQTRTERPPSIAVRARGVGIMGGGLKRGL